MINRDLMDNNNNNNDETKKNFKHLSFKNFQQKKYEISIKTHTQKETNLYISFL